MSTPLLFNIYFVTADNRTVPLQFIREQHDPTRGRLSLDQSSASQNALFVVDDLPPFLQQNQAFYLGQVYHPKIQVDNQQYYLSQVNAGRNIYNLIPATAGKLNDTNGLFSFALLNSKVGWGIPDVIANLHLDNIFLNGVVGYRFNAQPALTPEQALVYSPANCSQSSQNGAGPTFCGPEVCPDGFVSNNNICIPVDSVDGVPFGVRTATGIYTYKIRGNQIDAASARPDVISADIETNDTVRERWFFAEPSPGQRTLSVGGSYPIFIMANDRKFYLTNPQVIDQNVVRYTLSPTVTKDTARFNPTRVIQPQTLVDLDQFENFIVPNQSDVYLWSYQTQPLVNNGTTRQAVFLSQPVTTQFMSSLNTTPPATTARNTTTSHWWFWLLIILAIILLIALIGGLIYWARRPKPVYTPFATTTTRVTSTPLPTLA
jgi:hypothetical protein